MPFGICSAPEVFQRKMHKLIEGLQGVEVVADDFVIVGWGDMTEDASRDHDQNLSALLQRCVERGIKLNAEKIRLRLTEVPFIGHMAMKGFAWILLRYRPSRKCLLPEMWQLYNDFWG